jgi:hypothetical protein
MWDLGTEGADIVEDVLGRKSESRQLVALLWAALKGWNWLFRRVRIVFDWRPKHQGERKRTWDGQRLEKAVSERTKEEGGRKEEDRRLCSPRAAVLREGEQCRRSRH